MRAIDLTSIKRLALDAIFHRSSIQKLFDAVYRQLHLPMICFDTSFRHIAHVYQEPFYFASWVDIVENGIAQESNIVGFNYLQIQENFYAAGKSTYYDRGRSAAHPSTNGPISVDGNLVAYLGIMVEDCAIEEVLAVNDVLCSAASMLLAASSSGTKEFDLQSNNLSAAAIQNALGRRVIAPYLFVILNPKEKGTASLLFGENYFKRSFPDCISSIGNKHVYLLLCRVKRRDIMSRILQQFEDFARRYDFRISVSCSFGNLDCVADYRAQAELAMEVGRELHRDEALYFFRDLYVDILAYNALRTLPAGILIQPEFRQLLELSDKNRRENIDTLFSYILHFCNYSQTAKQLGRHKNSILYRIGRMEQELGVDFSNSIAVDRLLLSMTAHNILLGERFGTEAGNP